MRRQNLRAVLWMAAAVLLVLAVIGILAYMDQSSLNRSGIVLPSDTPSDQAESEPVGEQFAAVTPDNAPALVRAMQRPERYHQSLSIETIRGSASSVRTAEIWYAGGVWKIEQTEGGQVRHLLTDEKTAYLWYGDDLRTVRAQELPANVSPDDLTGIPTYETLAEASPQSVLEAHYEAPEELEGAPCLFAQTAQMRYWVDLAEGLLRKAERLDGENTAVRITQTALSLPEAEDPALARAMRLPNGQTPFAPTAEAKTPQS